MPLKHLAVCAASLALSTGAVQAGAWTEAASLKDLPAAVQQQLGVGNPDDAIADRGERFNGGCVLVDRTPRKRFLLGAVTGDIVVVGVEFGGIALHAQSIVFRRSGQAWVRAETRHLSRPVTVQELTRQHGGATLAALN